MTTTTNTVIDHPPSLNASTAARNAPLLDYLVYTFPSLLCASLGYWQLQRREEKLLKMNARAAALHCEPLQSLSEVTETTEEFRRVRVEGEMIKNSIRVGPKVRTSEVSNNEKIAGYDLITPMREKRNKNARRKGVWPFGGGGGSNDDVNDDDVVALVNRGFAERAFEDAKGGMCLKTIGVVRKGDVKGYFTPENVPEKNVWHYVDVRGIGEYLGLVVGGGSSHSSSIATLGKDENLNEDKKEKGFVPYVQLIRPIGTTTSTSSQQPIPVAEEELMKFSVLPEQHMNYSMTWFSLSAVTLGMASFALLKKKKVPKL